MYFIIISMSVANHTIATMPVSRPCHMVTYTKMIMKWQRSEHQNDMYVLEDIPWNICNQKLLRRYGASTYQMQQTVTWITYIISMILYYFASSHLKATLGRQIIYIYIYIYMGGGGGEVGVNGDVWCMNTTLALKWINICFSIIDSINRQCDHMLGVISANDCRIHGWSVVTDFAIFIYPGD